MSTRILNILEHGNEKIGNILETTYPVTFFLYSTENIS
jgi:hypothetical protein